VFEILGERGDEIRFSAAALHSFEAALEDYTAGRWEAAASRFRETLDLCGGRDEASSFYLEWLAQQSPEARQRRWDGVVDLVDVGP
jgi:hypothetical protein